MYEYRATVVRVVDGDTYDLDVDLGFHVTIRERFRLYGADTPEKFGSRASPEGHIASDFVKDLLAAQPMPVLIKTVKDRKGKYGRYLINILLTHDERGTQWDSEVWLSDYLIDKGLAERY